MFLKRSCVISIMLTILFRNYTDGLSYNRDSDAGAIARIDLVNSLKIALHLANPPPTEEELRAAKILVVFLNGSSLCDDYLEAYYPRTSIYDVNTFLEFLNGFILNGNYNLAARPAAEMLIEMIKTRMDPCAIETKRHELKNLDEPTKSILEIINNEIDYMELFRNKHLTSLKNRLRLIDSV